jgi:uncharacterized membrane protein YvbJ
MAVEDVVTGRDIRGLHARIRDLEVSLRQEIGKKQDKGDHLCTQEGRIGDLSRAMEGIGRDIRSINSNISNGRILKWSAVITVILAIISGTAYIVRSSEKTDSVERSVQKIETDVSDLRDSTKRVELDMAKVRAKGEVDMGEIRALFREELEYTKDNQVRSGRIGRR